MIFEDGVVIRDDEHRIGVWIPAWAYHELRRRFHEESNPALDVERLAYALSSEYESRKQWPRNDWDGIAKRLASEYARSDEEPAA